MAFQSAEMVTTRGLIGVPPQQSSPLQSVLTPPPPLTGAMGYAMNAVWRAAAVSVPTNNTAPAPGGPGSVGNGAVPGNTVTPGGARPIGQLPPVTDVQSFMAWCRANPVIAALGAAGVAYVAYKVLS